MSKSFRTKASAKRHAKRTRGSQRIWKSGKDWKSKTVKRKSRRKKK